MWARPCRFDEYLAQAAAAYKGTRILQHAGGLPKEEEDKEAMAKMFEVRALGRDPPSGFIYIHI